jgi:hypothetical protein
MRVLVCGDRNWTDKQKIKDRLSQLPQWAIIVEGEARGADSLARECAEELGMEIEAYPANWKKYGKAAGPVRNQQMLDSGIDLVIAFHPYITSSKGTKDMVRRAKLARIDTEIIS